MRVLLTCAALAALTGLAACTEEPQTLGTRTVGTPAAAGTGTAFVAPGWKAGDVTSWEEQTNSRTQRGQNEYTRITGS